MSKKKQEIVTDKKAQIGRRRYDTRTSSLVKTWEQEGWSESLYRKSTGEHFIFAVGESFPEGIIRPLKYDEAVAWMKNKFDMKLEEIYNSERDKNVMMSFQCPNWLREELRIRASDEKVPIGRIIIRAVREFLDV